MIQDLYCVHYITPEDNQGIESMLILVQGSRHGVSWKCSGRNLKITWFDSHCNLELMSKTAHNMLQHFCFHVCLFNTRECACSCCALYVPLECGLNAFTGAKDYEGLLHNYLVGYTLHDGVGNP
jgi:hypothetical protein